MLDRWFCFHTGRPSSLSPKDVTTELPQNPFVRLLIGLANTMSRSTEEIYGQSHESLLHMWHVARAIAKDVHRLESQLPQALGFSMDAEIQAGHLGVQQTMFITRMYPVPTL